MQNDMGQWLAENPAAVIAMICVGVAGLMSLAFWQYYRKSRVGRLVEDLPRSKTSGVFIGLVELQGTAEAEEPVISYLSENPCVYYEWTVEERWSREVTETHTDSKGNVQTSTHTESGWTQIGSGGDGIAFYLKDDNGCVLVRPEKARIEPQTVLDTTCRRSDSLYYAKGWPSAISNSDHVRRFVERAVVLHAPIYLMGQARERKDIIAPEIAYDPTAALFLISTHTQKQIISGYHWTCRGWIAFAALVPVATGFLLYRTAQEHQLVWWPFAASTSAFLFGWLCAWMMLIFNSLVDLRQRVRQGWANVDVQLKRRADLIRNLVDVVKGLRDYESTVQESLATLRSQLVATAPGQPGPDPAACIPAMQIVAEKYPELKANEVFLSLMKSLSDTEQRISLARGYFNEIATAYNTRIEVVPDSLIARLGAFTTQSYLEANQFERAPVNVDLAQEPVSA